MTLRTFLDSSEDNHPIPNEQVKRIKVLIQHKQKMVRNKTRFIEMDIPLLSQVIMGKTVCCTTELFWWKKLETTSNDLHLNQNYAKDLLNSKTLLYCVPEMKATWCSRRLKRSSDFYRMTVRQLFSWLSVIGAGTWSCI